MRILVADDETISRRMLAAALARLGHQVVPVEDGVRAWAVLSEPEPPRLVLLDWNMPELDGPGVCRRIREKQGVPYIYIILVTARNGADEIVAGLDAGADDFIAKPFDPEELRARVRAGQRIIELEQEKERSFSYLSAVLENIDSGVLLTDVSGKAVYSNVALNRLFGLPQEARVGREELQKYAAADGAGPVDIELQEPTRRVIRRTTTAVALPEGSGQIELYRDVTLDVERERAERYLARIDPLTGLLNRRGAAEEMTRECSRMVRTGKPLSVALIDIDHFKRVNDGYGHAVGDQVLQKVSRLIAGLIRTQDISIRWGGEELLVLLPATDAAGGVVVADRIRVAVSELVVSNLPPVTISVGVAQVAEGETTADAAIQRADERLYEAKRSGRNQVR